MKRDRAQSQMRKLSMISAALVFAARRIWRFHGPHGEGFATSQQCAAKGPV